MVYRPGRRLPIKKIKVPASRESRECGYAGGSSGQPHLSYFPTPFHPLDLIDLQLQNQEEGRPDVSQTDVDASCWGHSL